MKIDKLTDKECRILINKLNKKRPDILFSILNKKQQSKFDIKDNCSNYQIEQFIKNGKFIYAVKMYREMNKCSLLEAKNTCEKIRNELKI